MQIFTIFFYALAAECPVERFSEIYYNDRRKGMRLMTKDIKMLAIDLDGTLLHDDMSISPFTADILKKAWTKGIRIVVATGRMFCSARVKLLPLQLGDIPVVCYTGAWTARLESQQVISQDGISPELAGEILAFVRDREWKVQTFINDYAYMAQPDPLEQEYSQYRIRKTIYTGEDFYHPAETVTRMIIVEKNLQKRDNIRKFLEDRFQDRISIVYPERIFIDIHKAGVSKANAIGVLAARWGIRSEQIAAFGNTENDISMLRYAGHSFAVANAEPVAKEAADKTIGSNNEDGVAHAIATILKL
ncbi:HAD family hydrolase [Allisonella histaminiformans]|uniref:HAD family hydrolase n=1 Tax=Allisonella histaminiformans TaxID=209880 RepID=UPI002943F287|nr:HAD family hydrolase [Allisonella histaminiformans]